MISPRNLQSNQDNARASTGPRSALGKARSAGNARTHGLAIPIWSDRTLVAEAETLAHDIAGDGASPELLALARRIAEAQLHLTRVRQTRRDMIEPGMSYSFYWPRKRKNAPKPYNREHFKLLNAGPTPEKIALIITDLSEQLDLMDRYERRALSRRKAAIRAFDTARDDPTQTHAAVA